MNREQIIENWKDMRIPPDKLKKETVDMLIQDGLLIQDQAMQIFKLENRLKECENGYQGTLFMERCKLHDAEEKIEEQANVIKKLIMKIQKASERLEPLKTRMLEQHNETIDEVCERVKGLFAPDDEVIKEIDEISQELKIQC